MPPANPKPLRFKKNKNLLSGSGPNRGLPSAKLAFEASAPRDPKTAKALLKNDPFPVVPLRLGRASVDVSSGDEVSFGAGKGKASFSAGVGVFAELGVYKTPAAVFKAVEINEQVLPAVTLEGADGRLFVVLQSGYSLAAEGDASIALRPGFTPRIEASGGRARDYAVIRAIDAIEDIN